MKRKKLLYLFSAVILVLIVSMGFFLYVNEDPTTSASSSNIRTSGPIQSGDLLGSWSAGANITSPGSNGGAGVGYSRNDTCWLFALNGDENGSGLASGVLRRYNVNTNTWSNMAVDIGRAWTSICKIGPVSNTVLYAFGGLPTGATTWGQMTGSLRAYDINTNTWTSKLSAPTPAGSAGLYSYQDSLIYAAGGVGTAGSPINNVQLYNVNSNTWRAATVLPAARSYGWMVIKGDTIFFGCGAGPTTSTFNNTIYKGVISQTDRSVITWTTLSVTYPVSVHRNSAAEFMNGFIISPGSTAWWGTGAEVNTWQGGTSAFVSVGPVATATSSAMCGSVSFQRGNYKVWKFVIASGLVMSAPYHILNTQIYTDSVYNPVTPPITNPTNMCAYTNAPFTGLWGHASDNMDDTLYVAGGSATGSGSTNLLRYNINSNTSAPNGVPIPESKAGHTFTKCGNAFYLIGGGTSVTTGGTTCWKYTPSTGTWTSIAPLPSALSGHTAVNWGDSVVFVISGGWTTYSLTNYAYRPASNTWITTTSLPAGTGRRSAACGLTNGKIFLSCGYSATFRNDLQIGTIGADASTITWAAGPVVPFLGGKTGSSRPGGTAVNGKFYMITGETTPAPTSHDTIYVFDANSNTWSNIQGGRGPQTASNLWAAVSYKIFPSGNIKIFIPGGAIGTNLGQLCNLQVPACTITGIDPKTTPVTYSLSQNYPNPFNPTTTIKFTLPKSSRVELKVYDIAGKEVANLVNEQRVAGSYQVDFDASNLSSGVYFYRITAGEFTMTKKMLLIK
jgi:N-acetylneuraminic acid mutarotase